MAVMRLLHVSLRLHWGKEYLTTGKFYYKEYRATDQFTTHKKLNRKEVAGSQYIPMTLDKLMPGRSNG